MAGADVEDAGAEATCPLCSSVVKLHSMIPVLAAGATTTDGPQRVCIACARKLIVPTPAPDN